MGAFLDKCGKALPDETYDLALPQPWVNNMLKDTGINTPGEVVWLYDEQASTFGRPYAITLLGWIALRLFNLKWEP